MDSSDLVSNDQIVATAAANSSVDTVWFVYVIDIECFDHLSNSINGWVQSQWPSITTVSLIELSRKTKW